MMKYPIGVQDFEKLIDEGYIYVDKTEFIYKIAQTGNIFFLSRPRRFGKSLLISTLKAYFEGKRELFRGLAIEALEKEWREYPVIHLSFASGEYINDGNLEAKIEGFLADQEQKFGISTPKKTISERFLEIIKAAQTKTGMRVVILVDEYDKPLLDALDTDIKVKMPDGQEVLLEEKNRRLMKELYSTFKDADPYLKLVFLTGVTKFSQITVFSGFNQPEDISMSPDFESVCGITEAELLKYFGERIAELGVRWKMSADESAQQLKRRYDGYHMSENLTDIYNPFSILNVMKSGVLNDYWFKSGNPEYLVRLVKHAKININELVGKYYPASYFVDYKADAEQPLPMLYQSGYLTIKGYDPLTQTFLLDFPNEEVQRGFVPLIANSYLGKKASSEPMIANLVRAFNDTDLDQARDILTAFFASIPYTAYRRRSEKAREQYFHYTFYLLLRILSTYTVYTEKCQSQGRVDCVVECPKDIYIIEFKLNGSADEALQQIADRGYATEYLQDPRTLHQIGCVFLSASGTIGEWKVKEL